MISVNSMQSENSKTSDRSLTRLGKNMKQHGITSKIHEKNDEELRKKLETYEIQKTSEREALQYLTGNDCNMLISERR